MFWTEMEAIHKCGVKITVIEADCDVKNVYEFDSKKQPDFKGRGGTAYNGPIKHAKSLKVDGILYFGDGDCADRPEDPKIPFLWALVRNSPAPADFGKVIRIQDRP
jgi:predicted metal-dependent peptidase